MLNINMKDLQNTPYLLTGKAAVIRDGGEVLYLLGVFGDERH